ncbi:MAG: DUF952 domain-containing protein [Propionibacteriaceae bacterium]|nr:DUF952 domain-containing protein [Propionibacteriaceae bacterium]
MSDIVEDAPGQPEPALLPLWHIAHRADWEDAREGGAYLCSTRGRTLGEEGFIHCSYPHQVGLVARTLYADDPEPLVILEIDRDQLGGTKVRVETVDGVGYPHLFGPLPTAAVTAVRALAFDDQGALLLGDPEDPMGESSVQ